MHDDSTATPRSADDDLLATIKSWHREGLEKIAAWREQAREDFLFAAAEQWSDEDIAILKDQGRVPTVFDKIGPVVAAVIGTEVNNRQEVRFIPRELGDVGVNELLTKAAEYVRDDCDAEHEETQAFGDEVICGMGWTESRIDTDDNPDGDVKIERVDPLEMVWDTNAKRANLEDGRFVMRVCKIAKSEAEAMFPDADPSDLDASWATMPEGDIEVDEPPHESYSGESDPREQAGQHSLKTVTIVHCQWWERQKAWQVDGAEGPFEQSEAEFKQLSGRWKALMGTDLPARQVTKKVYRQAFVGRVVLLAEDAPVQGRFTFQAMTGKRHPKGGFMGIVRTMKDPQRWRNKAFSQALHIFNTNAKGGLMAEVNAFEDQRQAEDSWSDPQAITWLATGGLGKIKEKTAPEMPAILPALMQDADAAITAVSGISAEMIGTADREQAAALEWERKKAAMTVLSPLFDSLRRYRKASGRVLLDMIREYISDGRLVRISGDAQAAKYAPLVRDESVAEYDVIVDEAPASPNQKERTWSLLMTGQMMPVLKSMPPAAWLALLKYSPFPESVISELTQALQQASQPDPMQQQMEQAKAGAEIAETQAGAALDVAKAEAERVDTAAKAQEIQMRQAAAMMPVIPGAMQ